MKLKTMMVAAMGCLLMTVANAQNVRETIPLDKGWKFKLGHAADPQKDFGCGTEYFNYLTKANSIHNEGPYVQKFDDANWEEVQSGDDAGTIQLSCDAEGLKSSSLQITTRH